MYKPTSNAVRDCLRYSGWTHGELDRFIERHPRVWLQALQFGSLDLACEHVDVFQAYLDRDRMVK